MDSEHQRLEELFWQASQLPSETERVAFLDEACSDDLRLRREVEHLLSSRTAADEMAEAYQPTVALVRQDMADQTIGPYKLREKIGEGGMGMVYTADQKSPVKRRVALKVIKPGMDSRQVIARFESERQTLALMDHPNIAKVLDAGTTEQGLPYFVMELVNGVPITRYCDEHRLTVRQRLELLVPICRAVQHAHQKGIIHRDLKPSNILVAQYDGKPVPKVIDFGVAKAVGSQLGDYSVYTEFGMLVGTLEYMSPEQAQRNQLDIDTRSDVYSLGVVLYELLAGSTPFDGLRLRRAAFDEMLHIIREEEPPRPSLKLSTSRALPDVAASRSVSPERLSKVVRGELDWIVMKALEKDRARRYDSAQVFAADIEHFLASEPVSASPPSLAYSLRKYCRRNRVGIMVAACFAIVLLLASASFSWILWERASQQHLQTQRLARLVEQVGVSMEQRDWGRATTLLDQGLPDASGVETPNPWAQESQRLSRELQLQVALEEATQDSIRLTSTGGGWQLADAGFRIAFAAFGVDPEKETPDVVTTRLKARLTMTAPVYEALDSWALVKFNMATSPTTDWENSLAARIPGIVAEHESITESQRQQWVHLFRIANGLDGDPVRQRMRDAFAKSDLEETASELLDAWHQLDIDTQPLRTQLCLASFLSAKGLTDEAIAVAQSAQRSRPGEFLANYLLAGLLKANEKSAQEGVRFMTAALAIRPHSKGAMLGLASALAKAKSHVEAEDVLRRFVADSPKNPEAWLQLGDALANQGKLEEARQCYRHVLTLDPGFAAAYHGIGASFFVEKDYEQAVSILQQAAHTDARYLHSTRMVARIIGIQGDLEAAKKICREMIETYPDYASAYNQLGLILRQQGRLEESVECFRKGIQAKWHDDDAASVLNINLGMTLRRMSQDEDREIEAIEAFQKVVELRPAWAPGHDQLSRALSTTPSVHLRDPVKAVFHGQRAVELEQSQQGEASFYVWATMGMAYYSDRSFEKAIEALSRSLVLKENDRDTPTALYLLLSYWYLGKDEPKHQRLFEQVLERMNTTPDVQEQELLGEGMELLKERLEENPSDAGLYLKIGTIQHKLGHDSESIQTLKRGIEIAPDFTDLHDQLARVEKSKEKESEDQIRKK